MNKYQPHLYLIPEDDADRELANGFVSHSAVDDRRIQVKPSASGWRKVFDRFSDEYVHTLRNYELCHVVLLIDFDFHFAERKNEFLDAITDDYKSRVFVVGAKSNPEDLKRELQKSFEQIGADLAADCDRGTSDCWTREQLQHNESELKRLVETVRPFVLKSA